MDRFWLIMVGGAGLFGLCTGRAGSVLPAMLEGTGSAIRLAVQLAAAYGVWMGLLAVAREAGILRKAADFMQPVIRKLFPGCRTKGPLGETIATNFAANMLGMGNAATPAGLTAMRLLREEAPGDAATDAMCMFLIINTSSLELLPTTVLSLRQAAGSAQPAAILLPTLVATTCSTLAGILLALGFRRLWRAP